MRKLRLLRLISEPFSPIFINQSKSRYEFLRTDTGV
jgi:hypothetical protein